MCKMHKANAHEHTGSAETLRPSPRNGFTAYNVISPATGSLATVIPEKPLASHELDTSVGVSGPHDFAVRNSRTRLVRCRVHRIPHPTFRDDREAPLFEGCRMAQAGSADLPDGESEIFFGRGLDSFLVICPSRLGKYSRRPSTRRISFAVGAHAAGRRRIFIAPPSATENGFLLVREPIEYLPSLVRQ